MGEETSKTPGVGASFLELLVPPWEQEQEHPGLKRDYTKPTSEAEPQAAQQLSPGEPSKEKKMSGRRCRNWQTEMKVILSCLRMVGLPIKTWGYGCLWQWLSQLSSGSFYTLLHVGLQLNVDSTMLLQLLWNPEGTVCSGRTPKRYRGKVSHPSHPNE